MSVLPERPMAMTPSTIERAIRVLEVSASNIRSLGPAGFIPVPYRHWLQDIDETIAELKRESICLKCGKRFDAPTEKADF